MHSELEMAPAIGTADHLYGEYAVIMVDTATSASGCKAGNTLQYMQTGLKSAGVTSRIAFQNVMELEANEKTAPLAPFVQPFSKQTQQYVTLLLNTTGCGMGLSVLEQAAQRRERFDVAEVLRRSGAEVVAASYFSSTGEKSTPTTGSRKKAQNAFQKRSPEITVLSDGSAALAPLPTGIASIKALADAPAPSPDQAVSSLQPLQPLDPLAGGSNGQPAQTTLQSLPTSSQDPAVGQSSSAAQTLQPTQPSGGDPSQQTTLSSQTAAGPSAQVTGSLPPILQILVASPTSAGLVPTGSPQQGVQPSGQTQVPGAASPSGSLPPILRVDPAQTQASNGSPAQGTAIPNNTLTPISSGGLTLTGLTSAGINPSGVAQASGSLPPIVLSGSPTGGTAVLGQGQTTVAGAGPLPTAPGGGPGGNLPPILQPGSNGGAGGAGAAGPSGGIGGGLNGAVGGGATPTNGLPLVTAGASMLNLEGRWLMGGVVAVGVLIL